MDGTNIDIILVLISPHPRRGNSSLSGAGELKTNVCLLILNESFGIWQNGPANMCAIEQCRIQKSRKHIETSDTYTQNHPRFYINEHTILKGLGGGEAAAALPLLAIHI